MIRQRCPRSPDAANFGALPYVAEGAMLADIVATSGTTGVVSDAMDR